jgi:pimeloyl-ACP methyl ester carboxylesterase
MRRALPLLLLLGCHAAPPTAPPPPAAAPAPARALITDGVVDVGGASLHIHCVGDGAPPVVFESGLGNDGTIWKEVQPAVGGFTRACVTDRAGLGYSSPAPHPHSNRQMARELHALLDRAGLPAPYVLVGHSMGGANVRLFASEHLDEVAGMVLVDAVGDAQFTRWFVLSPEAMKTDFREGLPKLPEGLDFATYTAGVADMAAASKSIGARPLVVLSHGRSERAPGTSAGTQAKMEGVWADMQSQLCGLSSSCAHVTDATSGHFVQLDDPALVIASVKEVVEAAREHRKVNEASLKGAAAAP